MQKSVRKLALILVPLGLASCNPFATDPQVCHDGIFSAFLVEVRDSVSGDWLSGVSGIARKGQYEEVMEPRPFPGQPTRYSAMGDGPGTYDVEFSHPDYRTWSGKALVPDGGPCMEVDTSDLRLVLLQPLAEP